MMRSNHVRLATVVITLATLSGCAWFGNADERAREVAPEIHVGAHLEDVLHCDRGECSNWYRLVLEEPATVRIEADAPVHPSLPDFSLTLRSLGLNLLGQDKEPQERPRRISKSLAAGVYFVHVKALNEHDDRMSYKLSLKRERPPRAAKSRSKSRSRPTVRKPAASRPAAPPPPTLIESQLLEVERDGGEPVAVLLEAGTSHGIQRGMRGQLVEGGQVIGTIEVIAVYAAGSRARIVGGLAAPITLDTEARLQK